VADLEDNALSVQERTARARSGAGSDRSAEGSRASTFAAASTTELPHCGQLQPTSECTIATRQIGQGRKGLSSRIRPRCARRANAAIQD
jgi:hypothetical protein